MTSQALTTLFVDGVISDYLFNFFCQQYMYICETHSREDLNFFTGVFDPPVDGVYLLTAYADSASPQDGPVYIKNNDEVLCQFYIAADTFGAGCTAIAELAVGDPVRVTGDSANPAEIQAPWSGFAGHVISDSLIM